MLEELKTNFEKLISLYEAQKQRADALVDELDKEKANARAYKEQIDDLKGQISTLELKGAFIVSGDSSSVSKMRIDKLIKEIDKCITLLGKD